MPAYNHNLNDYKFEVVEIPDRDVYNMLSNKYKKSASGLDRFPEVKIGELKKASGYLALATASKGDVKFYRVHSFRIAGDTLDNIYLFLDNKNQYINKVDR